MAKMSEALEKTQEKLGVIQGGVEVVSKSSSEMHAIFAAMAGGTKISEEDRPINAELNGAQKILLDSPAHTTSLVAYAIFIAADDGKILHLSVQETMFNLGRSLSSISFLNNSEIEWMKDFALMLSIFRSVGILRYMSKENEELGVMLLQPGALDLLKTVKDRVENNDALKEAAKIIRNEFEENR